MSSIRLGMQNEPQVAPGFPKCRKQLRHFGKTVRRDVVKVEDRLRVCVNPLQFDR